jgi:hypothetical protein
VDPPAKLASLMDEQMLPVLEVEGIEQPGGTLTLQGATRLRVAEGGMLRLFASSDSEQPLVLHLALGEQRWERRVEPELLAADGAQGRAVRRGLFAVLLEDWMTAYQRAPDNELRRRIVEVSLREGIPTALTSLHVAAPGGSGELPGTATPAALLRVLGCLLLLLAMLGWWLAPRPRRLT